MSNYRDDSNDTAVIGDETWLGLSAIAEDTAMIAAALIFGLGVMHADTATASDQVLDRAHHVVIDSAVAHDQAMGRLNAKQLSADTARVSDQAPGRARILLTDSARATDEVVEALSQLVSDGASISDQVLAQRRSATLVADGARITDAALQFASQLVEDEAGAGDWAGGGMRARVLMTDAATVGDEVLDDHRAHAAVLVDTARVAGEVFDYLSARDLVVDVALVQDVVLGAGADGGQAWTANMDSWALSRYAPYTFLGLAVVDGVLYGMAEDGVYALTGGADAVAGSITTGKMDVGRGSLVHPVAAYLEYELEGTAEMDVTTTQSGAAQTYTYPLAHERADELTNGRFIFGRGLRGRHFSFTLRLTGQRAHINDLRVDATQTRRRT